MNVSGLKNNLNLWKSIETFPLYKELVKESQKYYNNTLVYCFTSVDKDLYIIEFIYNDDGSFDLKYRYFGDILRNIIKPHVEFDLYFNNIRKYGFNNTIKELFKTFSKYENTLVYYTHISNLFELIKNSI